ncbi:MAG: von Willebrand factor, partial [Pseudobdellovibrio sp.]|nr:von Willebrand factor [Pseudobdellovibrio sp.]
MTFESKASKLSVAVILTLQLSGCLLPKAADTVPVKTPLQQETKNPPQVTTQPEPAAKEDDLYSTYEIQKEKSVESPAPAQPQLAEYHGGDVQSAARTKKLISESAMPAYSGGGKGFIGGSRPAGMMAYAHKMSANNSMGAMPYELSAESYDTINENKFYQCTEKPVSTFSIDVDTASYSNMRRFITQGARPPADAVRIEELINYFDYKYQAPAKGAFAVNLEYAPALWNKKTKVVRIGIKGKEMEVTKRPASNLTFLIDVSGSMQSPQKLPLVKSSLKMLVEQLGENDRISLVVYAGAAGIVLAPTAGDKKSKILSAIDQLEAGGSTNGAQGIQLAYDVAKEHFIKGGVNRVLLATDGDFNVGITNRDALVELVEANAKKNIYLSVLGYGMGNYKDGMMETLSNKGNGNYAYIDNQNEAKKVLVEQITGTLVTIAKDVKIQVEFNPTFVKAYRLIGYENRNLKNEDFDNDAKDAGDIGAGHSVTALYEIVPQGAEAPSAAESLKYETVKPALKEKSAAADKNTSDELLTVKIRYKKPDGDVSDKQEFVLKKSETGFEESSDSFKFASAVALFGMLLRESEF